MEYVRKKLVFYYDRQLTLYSGCYNKNLTDTHQGCCFVWEFFTSLESVYRFLLTILFSPLEFVDMLSPFNVRLALVFFFFFDYSVVHSFFPKYPLWIKKKFVGTVVKWIFVGLTDSCSTKTKCYDYQKFLETQFKTVIRCVKCTKWISGVPIVEISCCDSWLLWPQRWTVIGKLYRWSGVICTETGK